MATSPRKRKAADATSELVTKKDDPQSWLFLNPQGPSAVGLGFGVLRKRYANRTNSASEFGRRKMQPIAPQGDATASPWPITAEQVEVLLPPNADDMLRAPEVLLHQADLAAASHGTALLTYLTLPFLPDDRLHIGWERCRAFAREVLARDRQLATVLVLHAPGRAGVPFRPHCHCLIVPRRVGHLGLTQGVYDEELIRDVGQALIQSLWTEHVKVFQ